MSLYPFHRGLRWACYVICFVLFIGSMLINKWGVNYLLPPTVIDDPLNFRNLVSVVRLVAILFTITAMILIWRSQILSLAKRARVSLVSLLSLAIIANFSWFAYESLQPKAFWSERYTAHETTFLDMQASEKLLLKLTPRLNELTVGIKNLRLPSSQSAALFQDQIQLQDLTVPEASELSSPVAYSDNISIGERAWRTAPSSFGPLTGIWNPYLQQVDYFDHAKFYFVKGNFKKNFLAPQTQWNAQVGFNGLARTKTGQWHSIHASINTEWQFNADAPLSDQWKMTRWQTVEFHTKEFEQPLFVDSTKANFTDTDTFVRAQHSLHDELIVRSVVDPEWKKPDQNFQHLASDHHPGIAITDINQDGFDDIYLVNQWGKNMMLLNQQDGTFQDIASDRGLDLENYCSSAIFADFDNDGDQDLFIGRTQVRSVYLENVDGYYRARPEAITSGKLPGFVSSVSVVDYDNDGLLDVYFSTYVSHYRPPEEPDDSPDAIENPNQDPRIIELKKIRLESESNFGFVNTTSTRNALFRNTGNGNFAEITDIPMTNRYRFTFQTTWCDFDDDGDQDAYCANDFGNDIIFRNEGSGQLVPLELNSEFLDSDSFGFSMGASWGDYDNDGHLDVYVSQMYSKAGKRILASNFKVAAGVRNGAFGNSLLRNLGNGKWKVREKGVERKAGWSWGSQFVDINNDGYLDIYALNGYYTAPAALAIPRDL